VIRSSTRSAAFALARRTAAFGTVAFLLALLLFLALGAARLWPRIAGQHLPFSLIWPFARPLLAVALELSFLVTPPIALGLATSTKTARSSGATVLASFATSGLLVAGLGGLSFGLSASLDGGRTTPGELASELVTSARQSCVESNPPAEVNVPLVGFSWRCEAHRAPRLSGKAPFGKNAQLEAAAITLSDDLRRVSLTDLALAFTTPLSPVRLHAKEATLRGLPPWGRSRRMPFALRAGLFVLSAWIAGCGIAQLVRRVPWLSPWASALAGGLVAGGAWFAFSWLERQDPAPFVTWVLPLAVLGVLGLEAVGLLAAPYLWRLWRHRLPTPGVPRNPQ